MKMSNLNAPASLQLSADDVAAMGAGECEPGETITFHGTAKVVSNDEGGMSLELAQASIEEDEGEEYGKGFGDKGEAEDEGENED